MHAEKWSINDINAVALEQNKKDENGISHVSVGVKTFYLLKFISINQALPPLLYLLLVLGNGICSKFK